MKPVILFLAFAFSGFAVAEEPAPKQCDILDCEACGYKVTIEINVIGPDGELLSGLAYASPEMSAPAALAAQNADAIILAQRWAEGLANYCAKAPVGDPTAMRAFKADSARTGVQRLLNDVMRQ